MHPTLIELGSFRLPTYGALLALGFVLGTLLVRRRAPRLGLDPDQMTTLAALVTLGGTLGSRIWYVARDAGVPLREQPWRVAALWEGGEVWYGALFGGLAVLFAARRRLAGQGRDLLDLFLPAASLAHLCGRLGCFAAGCCWGERTEVAWSVVFPFGSACGDPGEPLHPTQLYEAAGEAAIFLLLLGVWRHRPFPGSVGLAYLALYSALRIVVEPWRGGVTRDLVLGGLVSVAQLVSLGLLSLAVVLCIRAVARRHARGLRAHARGIRALAPEVSRR